MRAAATHRRVVHVPPGVANLVNDWLSRKTGLSGTTSGDTPVTFTALFPDGIEVDIKVCNGSDASEPFIDAVIFEHGSELYPLDPRFDRLEGDYAFTVGQDTYIVTVQTAA